MKKIALLMLIALSVSLVAGCGNKATSNSDTTNEPVTEASENPTDSSAEEERYLIPDFEMTLLNGDTVNLYDYKGKKILINFWASWCGPCVGEMPAFQQLSEEYPDDLVILAINCSEDASTVQQFVAANSYSFNFVLDEDSTIQNLFGGVNTIPVTLVIDEEGYLITGHKGAADAETMYKTYKEELGF